MPRHDAARPRAAALTATVLAAAVLAVTMLAGCGRAGVGDGDAKTTVRVGYFPNLTHAPAIVGLRQGFFAEELGSAATVHPSLFNAGPTEMEALFSGAIDIAYIGPSPTINGWQKSGGKAIRAVAGAASGGASLVVAPDIRTPADLRGRTLATPQLGNTQDVALRYWLDQQGFHTTPEGSGEVKVLPQDNAQSVQTFLTGDIDGAWVPEPYASVLRIEGHGRTLVDERSLWPNGRFVTTMVVVRAQFLDDHPDLVTRFLRGHVAAVDYLNDHPAAARRVVNAGLEQLTGKPLSDPVIAQAWRHLDFTVDPEAASLRADATHAEAVGLLDRVNLAGLYDLAPLNSVLRARGERAVTTR